MHETTLSSESLQRNFDKSQDAISRQRLCPVAYEFVPVPEFIERDIADPRLEKLWRIVLRSLRRGVAELPLRLLAHSMKKSVRTVQRYIRELVRLGRLIVTQRRVSHQRNLHNLFAIPELHGGVGDRFVVEKKRESLKTTTPAPKRGGLREFWNARFAHDKEDSRWKREQFEQKARHWAALKAWQLQKAIERTRLAMEASVGASYYVEMRTEEQIQADNAMYVAVQARYDEEKKHRCGGGK